MYFFSIFDFYSDKEESSENNIVQKSVAKFVLDNVLECNIFCGRTLWKITMKINIIMLPFVLGLENCHIKIYIDVFPYFIVQIERTFILRGASF